MGKLYIIPTPVGNLEDMTFRAVRLLNEVDLILAEDTRTSGVLLKHYKIENKLQSYHKFNEHKITSYIIDRLNSGQNIALISDAGTPGISDPGFLIIRECVRQNVKVECLPGATAFVPALVASAIPSDHFCFEGFLPQKKGRLSRLKELAEESRTIVIYESPYRVIKTLTQLAEHMGYERHAATCRELSKIHEEITRGSLKELISHFVVNEPKGEFVIIISGKSKDKKNIQ